MSTVWQHDVGGVDPGELTGFTVIALDGSIGTIDDATWNTDTDHIVVDTGPWISAGR